MVNSGWRNIKRDDFDGNNILIDFGEKAKILSAGIAKTGPSNIRHEVKVTTKNITIPPLLIKSNESMTFCVEVENYQEIKVDARIDGKEKTTKNLNPMRSLFLYNIGITIFISFGLPFVFSLPVVVAVKVILILFLFFITAALKVELMKRKILDKYVFERL
jgi:hypothetical protein